MPLTVGKRFFDQYSVICVFGSVVGCVVVPLIAQVRVRGQGTDLPLCVRSGIRVVL